MCQKQAEDFNKKTRSYFLKYIKEKRANVIYVCSRHAAYKKLIDFLESELRLPALSFTMKAIRSWFSHKDNHLSTRS